MATAKVCFMAPSLVGSLFASSPLQSCTSFGRDSKEESDPRGKYTAWESPLARLGSREYTPNYRYILLLNGRGGRGQRRHHSFCCTYLSSNRPPGSKRNIMARPEEFSFQNSQDISVPNVFKGLREVIQGDSGYSEGCLGTRFGYTGVQTSEKLDLEIGPSITEHPRASTRRTTEETRKGLQSR